MMDAQTDFELLTTRQACDFIEELTGERPDSETVRRWCKEGLGGPLDREPIILENTRNKLGHFVFQREAIEQFVTRMARRKAELAEFDAWRVTRKTGSGPGKGHNGQPQQARRSSNDPTPLESLAYVIHDRNAVTGPRHVRDGSAPAHSESPSTTAVWITLLLVGLAMAIVGWLTAGFDMLEPFAVLGLSTSVIGLGGLLWSAR